ncbi:hypothetical protein V6N13_047368 [Hibiscus sabdariffa]
MKDLDAFSSLRELYMSNNQLKDFVIHKGCCDLKKLEVLDLSWNTFEGMLPNYLDNLNSLRILDWKLLFARAAEHTLEFFPPEIREGAPIVQPPSSVFEEGILDWKYGWPVYWECTEFLFSAEDC